MGPSYNSNSLATSQIIISDIDYHDASPRDLKAYPIANSPRSKVTNPGLAPSKIITMKGQIMASTISAMDDFEDTFKGYFVGTGKNLDIPHGSGTRRFIATPYPPEVKRPGGLNWANVTLKFFCEYGYGVDTSSTSLATGSGVTTSSASWDITVGGSAEWQYPIITVTIVSGTVMTNKTVSIGNNINGMVCSITRTWSNGDVIVINPLGDTPVTVNGSEVEFDGSIPIFAKGAGTVTYADGFTTRSVSYSISQYRYWM